MFKLLGFFVLESEGFYTCCGYLGFMIAENRPCGMCGGSMFKDEVYEGGRINYRFFCSNKSCHFASESVRETAERDVVSNSAKVRAVLGAKEVKKLIGVVDKKKEEKFSKAHKKLLQRIKWRREKREHRARMVAKARASTARLLSQKKSKKFRKPEDDGMKMIFE